ncbi:DUF2304 domain-containing protein [Parahaliea aestuarii]|uniref:DUF2304 domain-containing protein n=1 Tax=Parahaliea aestuarii TaxID=1852021 RepID=A0A5C8ZLT4_9GAMM|nr:DUF2304 domain-containing protein [Parahaliea aestuarii]TXS89428.1 DUF2304 domain-containing protein [Parahaliea aestuarii]
MLAIVTATIGIGVAFIIVLLIRRDRLHVTHGLGWILVAAGFAVIGLFPKVIDIVARAAGVSYPPILALTLAVAILVIKILLMDIERSRIEARNQRMIQRVAMLEAELRQQQKSTAQGKTR